MPPCLVAHLAAVAAEEACRPASVAESEGRRFLSARNGRPASWPAEDASREEVLRVKEKS